MDQIKIRAKQLVKQMPIFILSYFLFAQGAFSESTYTKEKSVKFGQTKLTIGKKSVHVEVATTREQLSYGLMNRTSLADDTGMLFIFSNEETRSFWMKNTFVDLSIGFFNQNKKLIDIQDMIAVKSVVEEPKVYMSKNPAKYALEMPKGWFIKNKIKLGDSFKTIP